MKRECNDDRVISGGQGYVVKSHFGSFCECIPKHTAAGSVVGVFDIIVL